MYTEQETLHHKITSCTTYAASIRVREEKVCKSHIFKHVQLLISWSVMEICQGLVTL